MSIAFFFFSVTHTTFFSTNNNLFGITWFEILKFMKFNYILLVISSHLEFILKTKLEISVK